MKNVTKVSIGKLAFTLEEEAYNELKAYLDSLEAHFAGNPSASEIMDEIESRIAELLQERLGPGDVAGVQVVREIMAKLGSAPEMDAASDAGAGESVKPKKLYRDTVDKVLGGVCSGLAAYFGKDPALFRILAVVFTLTSGIGSHGIGYGIFVLAYLVCWLVIPAAKTVDERYSMHGKSMDIDSIQRNIETGAHEIEQAAKDFSRSHPGFWHSFARFWEALMGVILIVVAFGVMFAMLMTSVGVSVFMPATVSIVSASMLGPSWPMIFGIAVMLVAVLPVVGMLYGGIMMVTGFKSPRWHPGLIIFILWMVALLVVSFFIVRAAMVDPGLLETLREDIFETAHELCRFNWIFL